MQDSTEHMEPPPSDKSWLEMAPIGWNPPARHRVDPMRPANPRFTDAELEDLYQDFYRERVGRTGPNLTIGLIVAVICLAVSGVLAWLIVINYGVGQ